MLHLKTLWEFSDSHIEGGGPICSSKLNAKAKLHSRRWTIWKSSTAKLNEENEKHGQDDKASHSSPWSLPHR